MTKEQETVLMIKGMIADLPPAQAEAVKELVKHIKGCILKAGVPVGSLAIALIRAEMQLE